jgi:NSS family neurotransmitter:Na+ symporter
VAALTSAISMMEVGVAYLTEEKGMRRPTAVFLITAFAWTVGVLCSLSFGPLSGVKILGNGIFDFADTFASNVLLLVGGLLSVILVGWVMPRKKIFAELTNKGTLRRNVQLFPLVYFLVRYVAPIGILALILASIL